MKRSEALKKLEKFAADLNPDGSPEVMAKWILDFVEQELEMTPTNNTSKQLFYDLEYVPPWDEENGEET